MLIRMSDGNILNASQIASVILTTRVEEEGTWTEINLVNDQFFRYKGDIREKIWKEANLALSK
jgi:hypothetical protein